MCQAGQGQGTATSMWVAQSSLWIWPMQEGGMDGMQSPGADPASWAWLTATPAAGAKGENQLFSVKINFFPSIIILSRIKLYFFNN